MGEIENQLKMYREGLTYAEIGKRTNSTAKEVQQRVRAYKKQIKQVDRLLDAEELQTLRDRIKTLRQQGLTMKAIGREVGLNQMAIYSHLRAIGMDY